MRWIILGLLCWMIWQPAIINDDALYQVEQAVGQRAHDDIHLVFTTTLMAGLFKAGFTMSMLTLALSCVWWSSLLYLVRSVTSRALVAVLAMCAFIPLPLYSVTWVKDYWMCVPIFLITGMTIRGRRPKTRGLLMALTLLIRSNAALMLPLYWLSLKKNEMRTPIVITAVILATVISSICYSILAPVERSHNWYQLVIADSVGMMQKVGPEGFSELNEYVTDLDAYTIGSQGTLHHAIQYNPARTNVNKFIEQYVAGALKHPCVYMQVKLEALWETISPQVMISTGIWRSGRRFGQNKQFARLRDRIDAYYMAMSENIPHRILFGHAFWIAISLAYAAYRPRVGILLVGYYAGYMLCALGSDFRFMAPATTTMQAIAFGLTAERLTKKKPDQPTAQSRP